MTLKEIRNKLKEKNDGVFGKITVIKRDGDIFCREDIGSPRNSNLKLDMFNSFVKRTLNVETECKIVQGRKGIYSNYWIEVIIKKEISKFKVSHIVCRNGIEEIVNSSDNPFEWFPELERFCTNNFAVKTLSFDLDLTKQDGLSKDVDRITFKVEKV